MKFSFSVESQDVLKDPGRSIEIKLALLENKKEIIFTSRYQREYKYTDMEREGVAQRKNFNLK